MAPVDPEVWKTCAPNGRNAYITAESHISVLTTLLLQEASQVFRARGSGCACGLMWRKLLHQPYHSLAAQLPAL